MPLTLRFRAEQSFLGAFVEPLFEGDLIEMITELQKNELYRCKALLNEQGQLEVKAVVEGVNPGRIFVDQINKS